MNIENIILLADSYKYSHANQYPENMVSMFSYMEARSSKVYPATVFFGLQYYILNYLQDEITPEMIDEAEDLITRHGLPFNREGWEYIASLGFLPLRIRAVPEGSLIPNGNVLMTIESTDPKVPWLAGWAETLLMKLWYPCTVATKSYYVKEMLKKYKVDTAFAYHNFGDRGSSSVESAAIGGMAHLTQFMGTDNLNSLLYIEDFYHTKNAGFSIPATEHSTVTSHGRSNEYNFYDKYLEDNKDAPMIACVMDSYDIYEGVKYVTSGSFREKVESDTYPIFVIRPDSGEPIEVMTNILKRLITSTDSTMVDGMISFCKYRVIWGDGITPEVIEDIMKLCVELNVSPDMVNFGSGGDLMQNINRDTLGFAIKCSSIELEEVGSPGYPAPFTYTRAVYKDPIHGAKRSKQGRVSTYLEDGEYRTHVGDKIPGEVLRTVFENGQAVNTTTFEEIRTRN